MGAVDDVGDREAAVRLGVVAPPATGPPRDVAARRLHARRLPLMALGMLALLGALWGGLVRLGISLPAGGVPLAAFHGPLMVSGFLGTVIAMERAVALGRAWGYVAPVLTGLGVVTLVAGGTTGPGPWLLAMGSASVTVMFAALLRRQPALFVAVMALGAVAWLCGQALWLAGWPVYRVVPWWVGFLVLTIAGERLELARVMRPSPRSRAAFLVVITTLTAGLVVTTVAPAAGVRGIGVALVGLALWLAREDIARRTVRMSGLTRFVAVALLAGYVWLAVGGVLAVAFGDVAAGPPYDAMLHALFVGFVFSMIFGHAPIIVPAVLGPAVPYRPAFYIHLVLLHASLAVRIIGDVAGWLPARQWGGLGNTLAIALFLASTAYATARAGHRGR